MNCLSSPRSTTMPLIAAVCCGLTMMSACLRDDPPQVSLPSPSPAPVVEEEVVEPAADTSNALPSEPTPPPQPEAKPEPTKEPDKKPEPEKPKEEPKAERSIIGRWRVTDMSHDGESSPEMQQMSMTLEFKDGGGVTVNMAHPQMPESQSQEGTYSLDGDKITLNIDGDDNAGTLEWLSDDSIKIGIEDSGRKVEITLARM